MITNQDPDRQIENDETRGAEYPNENDSENTKTNKTYAIPNFMPKILPDDEIEEGINSLNLQQRDVFIMPHTWAKENIMGMILNQWR